MKLLKRLVICSLALVVTLLITACDGVKITPNNDGSVVVTPNNGNDSGSSNNGGNTVVTPNGGNNGSGNHGGGNNDKPNDKEEIHSHTYKLYKVDDSSYSCTVGGTVTWRCECGESFTDSVDTPGHDMRSYDGKEATCEAAGYKPYKKCVRGNCDYTTFEEIPALGHSLNHYADVEPTCTSAGVKDRAECRREGCSYYTETPVSALGHNLSRVEGKAATCTEAGYQSYEICTRASCDGKNIASVIVIDPLGHDNVSYEAKEPTCTEFGWYAYSVCQRCSHSTYSQRSATGHNYVNGYCECGQVNLDLHIHVWNEGTVTIAATCTSSGVMKYTCTDTNCLDTKNEEIAPLGHDNKSYAASAATCMAEGWYAYKECQRCGYSTKITIPMIDHSYTGVITTRPTCTMSGIRTYTCTCGKNYTVEIEKLGHDWGNWYVTQDATCDHSGQEQRVCFNDTSHVDIRTISKTGHSFGDWTVLFESTCVIKGQEKRVCDNNSDHAEIREMPFADHKVNASTGICSVCGERIFDRLDAPNEITKNNSVIYWNTVEGADYYEAIVDGTPVKVFSTKLDLEEYYGTNYELQIKIRAIAPEGSGVISSAYLEYIFDIPNEPIADFDGLGEAVNLLTGGYTETDNRRLSIFNDALFNRLRVEEDEERNSYSTVRYAETLHGYVDKLTTSLSSKVDMKISADYMKIVNATAGYSFEINTGYEKKTQSDTKAVFYDMDYYYTSKRAGIYGSNDLSVLSAALSEDFLLNAAKVQSGELSPETFINWYGTHIITSGVYGGSFNLHYEMISTTTKVNETFKVGSRIEISSQVAAAIKGLELKETIDSSISTNYEAFKTNSGSDVQSEFTLVTNGGNITGKVCESLDDFSAVCDAWVADLKNGEDYVLINVDDGSLVFIWELLDDEKYAGAKNALYNYFYSTCDEQYYALKDKISSLYKDSYIFDETEGTMVIDFSELQTHTNVPLSNIEYTMEGGTLVFDGSKGIFTVYPKFNGCDVKKVIFKGNYLVDDESGTPYTGKFTPLTIKFTENWKQDIVIEFENFAYEAPVGYAGLDFNAVSSENITIIVSGKAYIKGGDGASAGATGYIGINAAGKNLTITGAGELEVRGGNGIDGYNATTTGKCDRGPTGGTGGVGGIAVKAAKLTVDTEVTINGGKGGNGGNGGNGWSGFGVGDSHGGHGGTGGAGGDAIQADEIIIESNGNLIATGGTGGSGGNGGRGDEYGADDAWGGNGGRGGNGGCSHDSLCAIIDEGGFANFIPGTGGNGGNGGAGEGADGGSGGSYGSGSSGAR